MLNPVVQEWTDKAKNDHQDAFQLLKLGSSGSYDTICSLSQQCIEKLIKAILIRYKVKFPKTHEFQVLYDLVYVVVPSWQPDLNDLYWLSRGAFEYQYPGESASQEDAQKSFSLCNQYWLELMAILERSFFDS